MNRRRIVGRDLPNYGIISKEYISISMRHFGETQSKATRAYAQSRQYHTIVESYDSYHGIRVILLT